MGSCVMLCFACEGHFLEIHSLDLPHVSTCSIKAPLRQVLHESLKGLFDGRELFQQLGTEFFHGATRANTKAW